MADVAHVPVLLDRALELFAPALADRDAVLVDATVGLGGHAEALLLAHPRLQLIGLDRDPDALAASAARLAPFGERVRLVHCVYDDIANVLGQFGLAGVDGVLLDLGVSSMQLDRADRGFAYSADVPLDMRMDRTSGRTAADVVNTYSARELARILREYGEERFAARVAAAIVRERERQPLSTSGRLVEIVREAIPAATRRTGGNPAKRTFQALRIEVNRELDVLGRAMPAAVAALTVGGRIVVMAYHSLEDRLVKRVLVAGATSTAPARLPIVPPEYEPRLKLLTRGAEGPGAAELAVNPRSASARLRAAERIREAA